MITTDLDRLEYAQSGTDNTQIFRASGTDIPVKDSAHIKVYVTTTGVFTAAFATSTVNLLDTAHGHLNTETITLSASTSLPTGLLANTIYYVVNTATNDFEVSLSSGGSAVAFTTNGSGTLTWTKTLLKAITTDYTISLSGTTATLTWESGKRPAALDKVLLLREVPFEQNTDLQNNSLFEAESVETQLDLIVNMAQQLKNTTARDLKFSDLLVASDATEAAATLTATADGRKNKSLKFDSLGNLGVTTIDVDDAQDYTLEAKSWATESPEVVNTYSGTVATPISSTYSAKEHAVGTPPDGSAKEWATTDTVAVAGGLYSSKQYAANSSTSATESAASETAASASADAVAVMYDAFHDKFLGSMADGATQGTNPTPTGQWLKNSSTITVSSNTNIKVGQIVVGAGIETSPVPNVISIDGTAIVISDNMAAVSASSTVALTFTGHGIYGTFDGSKDGPALNNDGDALTDGLLYFNTTDDVLKVYDLDDTLWRQTTPTSAQQTTIDTVAGISSEVTAVAGDATDIGAVAAKATEIGRLGTADAVADMAILGTADVVVDLNTLGTADVVTDLNTLGTADVVTDMNTLGTGANVINMATLGASGVVANVATVAGVSGNVTTVATNIANVNTTATNIADVNNFADVYQIDDFLPSAPTTDGGGNAVAEGDLAFDTTSNVVKAYDGSSWITATVSGTVPAAGGTFTGAVTFNAQPTFSGGIGIVKEATSQFLTGAITESYCLSLAYIVTGDVTFSGNVIFGKMIDGTTNVSITNDGTTRTLSGSGTLLLNSVMFN